MATLAELVVKLTGDIGGFSGAMHSAEGVAKSAGSGIMAALGGIGKVAAVAGGVAVAGIGAMAGAALGGVAAVNSWAGELDALGDVLGTSADESAALAVAIRGVGGDTQAITGQMARMVGTLKDAKGGLGEGGKLMQSMGIAFQDANGQLLPTTTILTNIADQFSKLPDGLAKTEALTTLFGKSGKDLGDTLNSLANGGLSAAADKAKALGLAIGDDGVNRTIEFNKGMETLKMSAQGLMVTLGNELMPVITPLIQQFAAWAVSVMPLVVEGIKSIVTWAKDNLLPAFQTAVGWVTANWPAIQTVIETVFNAAKGIVENVLVPAFNVIVAAAQQVVAWLQANWPAIQAVAEGVFAAVKGYVDTVLVPAFNFIVAQAQKIIAWLQSNWPLIQRTAETVFNAIQTVITTVFNAVRSVVETVWPIIQTVVETAINAVLGVIKTVMQIIDGDWTGAWNTIKATFEGVWNGISSFLTGIWNAIKGTVLDGINAVIGFINNSFIDPINTAIRSVNAALGTAIGQVQRLQSLAGSNGLLPGTVVTFSGAVGNAAGGSGGGNFGGGAARGNANVAYVTVNVYGADEKAARDGVVQGLRRAGLAVAA